MWHIVRIAYLLLSLLPGPAFVFYLAAWLLLPDQRNSIALETFLEKRAPQARRNRHPPAATVVR